MKKFSYTVVLLVLSLALMAGSVSAMVGYSSYNTGTSGCYTGTSGCYTGGASGCYTGGASGCYTGSAPAYGGQTAMVPGCGAAAPIYRPSPQYCTKWIEGHWIQVRVMMPGRWVYKPVWIPAYPKTENKWVPGFWQTTATNVRPDLRIWGSQQTGWFGQPYQQNQATSGYFTPQGVWVPTR